MAQKPKRPSVVEAYPGMRKAAPMPDPEPSRKARVAKVVASLVTILLVGMVAWWAYKAMEGPDVPPGPYVGEDERVVRMIKDAGGLVDLKEWLNAHPGRMLMGMERRRAEALEEQLVKMGAKRVCAFRGGLVAVTIVAELPENQGQRDEIFKWWQEHWSNYQNQARGDVGQRFILIFMKV